MEITFTINGKEYSANPSTVPVETNLNTFIRDHASLKGTKFMCNEGGCGACIVCVKKIDPVTKETNIWAANSCLLPLYSCHGCDIITIEGVGNRKDGYHKIQTRLAHFNGTQCGYCSPAMVMNMYSLYESKNGLIKAEEIENSFGGNICRCTGYRPILDAFKSFATDAPKELLKTVKDIEDLHKICPKTNSPCAGKCHAAEKATKNPISLKFADGKEWLKVNTLNDLLTGLKSSGDKPTMLVAGNTAHGIYRRDPNLVRFIDITGIPELHAYKIGNEIELGGNLGITKTMQILAEAAEKSPNFSYAKTMIKHIDLVAHVPVRNFGTLAGNLSIKNQHLEFPSDIFLMLETLGAKITIMDVNKATIEVSPVKYLEMDMKQKVITKIVLPALDPKIYDFRSYKIMIRAQNAHAYVNASFLFKYANDRRDRLAEARICFGGIKAEFTHATKTEAFLAGKPLIDNDTLQKAISSLNNEIQPDWVLPDASPEYRKKLAISLFYKAILSIAPKEKVDQRYLSGASILERPLSSGKQTFDSKKANWPLNQDIPKIEGLMQCAGEAEYTNDIPYHPNELYAAFVVADRVRHNIDMIDAKDALALPGVVAFYSAKDIPGENNFAMIGVLSEEKQEIFCSKTVLYHSQAVGVVVADSWLKAIEAAKLVKITYAPKKQPIMPTIKEVLAFGAKDRIHPVPPKPTPAKRTNRADVHTISGRFECGPQYHYYMEPQVCYVLPTDLGLEVTAATQWADSIQVTISKMLNIPQNTVSVTVKRVGGSYGGKISRPSQISCAAALAAHSLNRPIRFVMQLEAAMMIIGKRFSCTSDYEVETDQNGRIEMLDNNFVEDAGAHANELTIMHASEFFKNVYNIKNWAVAGSYAITDAAVNLYCRAPGTTEGIAMIENIMEHVAWKTGKDPADVRLINFADDTEMKTMFPEFLKDVDYRNRRKAIDEYNKTNRWRKRGIGLCVMKYPFNYFGYYHAFVSIYAGDGTVAISHGVIEMGQGVNTKAAQVAAHILGIDYTMVTIKPTNTLTSANDMVTGGSIGSESVCYAVKKCCEELLERLKPIREKHKNASWPELIRQAAMDNVDLISTYMYKAAELKDYNIWGLSCAEIEVDLLSGNLLINRVDILEDTGESLSPGIDVGQVEGAFIMGVGYWLTEELTYDKQTGAVLNNRTWFYKPPGVKDIPIDFRVKFRHNSSNPHGVLRSKATGEPATNMAIVVLFALRHALHSARKDAGLDKEWLELGAPTTPETILLSAGNALESYKLK